MVLGFGNREFRGVAGGGGGRNCGVGTTGTGTGTDSSRGKIPGQFQKSQSSSLGLSTEAIIFPSGNESCSVCIRYSHLE